LGIRARRSVRGRSVGRSSRSLLVDRADRPCTARSVRLTGLTPVGPRSTPGQTLQTLTTPTTGEKHLIERQ
jgi:hypothetical protein